VRKRSKYRPKPIIRNPVGYVIENIQTIASYGPYLRNMHIVNHGAMRALVRGEASRGDMDILIAMNNIVEALWRKGVGREYTDVITDGNKTLKTVAQRFSAQGRVTLYAKEIEALNALMELHDAQMDVITVKDMLDAVEYIKREVAQGRAERIIQTKGETECSPPN
jgi:hypothetical protein